MLLHIYSNCNICYIIAEEKRFPDFEDFGYHIFTFLLIQLYNLLLIQNNNLSIYCTFVDLAKDLSWRTNCH